jgi:hypothetical protein
MLFRELSLQEKSALDVTHQCVATANDLTQATAAAAQSFNVAALPVGAIINGVWVRLITPFQDPADAAFNSNTVDVGDTGSATRFATAQQLNANGAFITAPVYSPTQGGPYAASQFLTVNFNSMAAKSLANLKRGELHVFLRLVDAKKLSDMTPSTPLTK